MLSFPPDGRLRDFQDFILKVYGVPDDRLFSIWDLVSNQERFATRALKGIRKGDYEKIKYNLLIAFSWLMAVANRFHIDIEEEVWQRFPALCSYCGKRPCECKKIKPPRRLEVPHYEGRRPKTISGYQSMFNDIYPPQGRTAADAGVHLAEEMGEASEAIHSYLGEHKEDQFAKLQMELADLVSCIFGVANSVKIEVAKELALIFNNNCHICHEAPCVCSFSSVAKFKS
jgi:NTP pyrophosphatase (non-canonical NTP hydrolase)